MKAKLISFIKSLILKESNKISFSKFFAWLAGVCGAIVLSQGVIISNGIVIPVEYMPIFKWCGIISGIYAIIKTRDSKISITTTQQPDNK